jgi:LPS export ABC transporter protein LptC
MVIIDMDHYLTRLGVRRARLLADTAEYVSENEIHLRPVELIFFDDDGREVSVLNADFGVFNEVSEDMEATGNVVVLDRRDDRKLDTDQIRYTKEEDRLYGDSPFVMESNSGRTVTEGDAFEADPGLDNVIIDGPRGSSVPRTDTLTAEPLDSGAVATPDSPTAEAPDSLVVPDSAAADSTAVVRDTAGRDTTSRDTTATVPDSTARDTTARDSTSSARRRERAGPGSG